MTPRAETLTPADRAQLVQILDRLGSDNERVRAAAVWLANDFLRDRGLTWAELIIRRAPQPAPGDWQRRAAWGDWQRCAAWGDWQRRAVWCAERPELLTPWDQSFLASIARLPHPLTLKQKRIIVRLVARRMAAERGGA